MVKDPIRISMWSGPRNISTAMMYSFAQRADTQVYDEPLYGYYLKNSTAGEYHPGAKEVLETMETDGNVVINMMLGSHRKPIVFFKQMTHHLLDLNLDFLGQMKNILLTRDPAEMITSYTEVIKSPTMEDLGYEQHFVLLEKMKALNNPPVVIDSKEILLNPTKKLQELCEVLKIPFDKKMLHWKPGSRPEDGVWAKYWYKSVHQSSGFMKYKPKEKKVPEHLHHLLERCNYCYQELKKLAI